MSCCIRILNLLVLRIFLLLLIGCSGFESTHRVEPDWVKSTSARYSNDFFVTSRGISQNLDFAKASARSLLIANILNGNPESEQDASIDLLFNNELNYKTVLYGLQYADIWKDLQTKNVFVFAVLSRTRIQKNLQNEIHRLDTITNQSIAHAGKTQDKLNKLALAHLALRAQIRRTSIVHALNRFTNTNNFARSVWKIAKLEKDLLKLKNRIRIRPLVIDDATHAIGPQLKAVFSPYGEVQEKTSADYTVEIKLSLNNVTQNNNSFLQSGRLELKLIDDKHDVRGEKVWLIESRSSTKLTLKQNIGTKVKDIVKKIEIEIIRIVRK